MIVTRFKLAQSSWQQVMRNKVSGLDQPTLADRYIVHNPSSFCLAGPACCPSDCVGDTKRCSVGGLL